LTVRKCVFQQEQADSAAAVEHNREGCDMD
jgi:hypothetical protein